MRVENKEERSVTPIRHAVRMEDVEVYPSWTPVMYYARGGDSEAHYVAV